MNFMMTDEPEEDISIPLTPSDIPKLSLNPSEIDTAECLPYLQKLDILSYSRSNNEHLLLHLVAVIKKECETKPGRITCSINQVVLNVAFRGYFLILQKLDLLDGFFYSLPQELTHENESKFIMLYAILLTENWKNMDVKDLEEKCTSALIKAIDSNNNSFVAILKTLNLLIKKSKNLQLHRIDLKYFHHCLQSKQRGVREETLTLFTHYCKDECLAHQFFWIVMNYWPWTNRNKYYLLSCLLNNHNLMYFFRETKKTDNFFNGLRMSLSHKSLLPASQYLVRSLSAQNSEELLALSIEIFTNGTLAEIQNFYSQWFTQIKQIRDLFNLMKDELKIIDLLQNTDMLQNDRVAQYRLILLFSMFSKEILSLSKLYFYKMSTEILTNCFDYDIDAQLLVYKFLINNLNSFAIEDCLDFHIKFMKEHNSIENAKFRNTMLGNLVPIINHIAKFYMKDLKSDMYAYTDCITKYFVQLHAMIEADIKETSYQPKIFALKLLEILYNSLYATKVVKNAKNCSREQNHELGFYLITIGVFNADKMTKKLLKLLSQTGNCDDVYELIVSILNRLNCLPKQDCIKLMFRKCASNDIDECALGRYFARLLASKLNDNEAMVNLYNRLCLQIELNLRDIKSDALLSALTGKHIFGYINATIELIHSSCLYLTYRLAGKVVKLIDTVNTEVLDLLSLSVPNNDRQNSLASFFDIDESLQLLIDRTSIKKQRSDQDYRKYLLTTFWLTLKACSDLTATVGCMYGYTVTDKCHKLFQECLDINVSVLTRFRHKGAIEAAGVSIGKLTKALMNDVNDMHDIRILMLQSFLAHSLDIKNRNVSTTRRGAGYSILFLHIVKNDEPNMRPLLASAMELIFENLNDGSHKVAKDNGNFDRLDVLTLHYLCVLVRDTELRAGMSYYYNDIIQAVIKYIDNSDWTVRNASLQLFGSLVPKLVGQRQATEFDDAIEWEPTELNYEELSFILPNACQHILKYFKKGQKPTTLGIVLFLSFFAKVEHLCHAENEILKNAFLLELRTLCYGFLEHHSEHVRKLAATCLARAHEIRYDLSKHISYLILFINECDKFTENHFQGIVYALHDALLKLHNESKNTLSKTLVKSKMECWYDQLCEIGLEHTQHLSYYTLTKFVNMMERFEHYGFKLDDRYLKQLDVKRPMRIGHDLWLQKLEHLRGQSA